jgi:glycosyltransferase involved in cell wall biosynthesis
MINSPPALRVLNNSRPPAPINAGGRLLPPGVWVDVPWEFFSQFGALKELQFDFGQAGSTLAARTPDGRPVFDFWCPLSMVDGYGRHALAIAASLGKLGAEVYLRDVGWTPGGQPFLPKEVEYQARANRERLPSRIGVCMSVPYDPTICHHSSVYKIAITQFETDTIPGFHVKQVNRTDHLIVTSHFQPEVWRRSGVRDDLPISVLTPGVDTDLFAYQPRKRDGVFRVLMLGALTARKDPRVAIRAFQDASQGDPNWRFTIKTRRAGGFDTLLKELGFQFRTEQDEKGTWVVHLPWPFRAPAPNDSRIEIVMSDDPPDQVREWYWSHDCLLWPSKGEGVGLPPLEAMSCGLEVVMANNSGMADYAYAKHCWPVRTSHMEYADDPGGFSKNYVDTYGDVGRWWVPDYGEVVRQLRKCHDSWKKGRGKGERAAEYVRKHHNLELQAHSVLEVIETYA